MNQPEEQQPEIEEAVEEAGSQENGDLEAELRECQAKASEYLDGWQRARAEFTNYKRRVERDQALVYQNVPANVSRFESHTRGPKTARQRVRGCPGQRHRARTVNSIWRRRRSRWRLRGRISIPAPRSHHQKNRSLSGQIIRVVKQGYWMAVGPATGPGGEIN
jgi:molecular chaperone GrpE